MVPIQSRDSTVDAASCSSRILLPIAPSPDSKETLHAQGKVIWVQKPVAGRKELSAGMGVQFNDFNTEQRKVLENFVQRYRNRSQTAKQSA